MSTIKSVILFATVEHSFQIAGRGCVIVPNEPDSHLNFRLKAKDRIQLRNPDGRVLDTYIAAIEFLCGPIVKGRLALMLPNHITKLDVSPGAEIWLAGSN